MMGFGMGFGMLFIGLFWIALIVGAVWLVGGLFQGGRSPNITSGRGQSPREILDERYARGEITREQYELMKSDLQ
jgi:putative membrane protein